MARLVAKRYRLESERTGEICPAFIAEDLHDSTGSVVLGHQARVHDPSELWQIIRRRADELQRLAHPAHHPLLDYGFDAAWGGYYFIYSLNFGTRIRSLERYLADNPNRTTLWSVQFLLGLADYLCTLHRQHLVHGDLKSSGIYVDPAETGVLAPRASLVEAFST